MPLRKIMRSSIPAVLFVTLLVSLCFTAACTIPFVNEPKQENTTTYVNVGVERVANPDETRFTSLAEAYANLKDSLPGSDMGNQGAIRVFYIQGTGLDTTGRSAQWMMGVNLTSGTMLMISDPRGWTRIPWSSRLPAQEIPLDKIISPEELFAKNKDSILSDSSLSISETRDLDLREGVYSLTITSGGSVRYLTFDAITGEPVVLR